MCLLVEELNLDRFEEILLQHRKDRFLVVDPFGGKGDQLIHMGMEKKLRELRINYKVLRYKTMNARLFETEKMLSLLRLRGSVAEKLKYVAGPIYNLTYKKGSKIRDASADVVLLRGGAYLNDVWKDYDILECAIRDNPHCTLIVAPQSFFFNSTRFPEFFEKSKQEIHLFCRERYSYDLLCSMHFPKNVHINLSHDTALYLPKEDFKLQNEKGTYVLIAPRDDRESIVTWKTKQIPKQVKIFFGDIENVANFESFVNLVGNACKVYTDRLHVAILSAILGKETYLYPNSYYKNKGVYEFSLSGFPNVKFIESHEFLGVDYQPQLIH